MLAAGHIHPRLTIPLALALAAVLAWYWHRMGRPGVPTIRRRLRRFSLILMLVSLPLLVAGLSFLDRRAHSGAYFNVWTLALLLMLAIILLALLDAVLNVRLLRNDRREAISDAARELIEAARAAKESAAEAEQPLGNGQRDERMDGDGDDTEDRS
jgi:putative copper export protein